MRPRTTHLDPLRTRRAPPTIAGARRVLPLPMDALPVALNLDRRIDRPHSTVGRVLLRCRATGHVLAVTPIRGWHQGGWDWVTLAFDDPDGNFTIVRDEIAPRELAAQVEPPPGPDDGPVRFDDADNR